MATLGSTEWKQLFVESINIRLDDISRLQLFIDKATVNYKFLEQQKINLIKIKESVTKLELLEKISNNDLLASMKKQILNSVKEKNK